MDLRVHHFFDIIRDFGIGKDIIPHFYGHSYHKISQLIRNDPNIKIRIVLNIDDICNGCVHLVNNSCEDIITHRADFNSKEEFNDFIDKRIINKCEIKIGNILTPKELCEKAKEYLNYIFWIYKGNDIEHTKIRKMNFIKGLEYYKSKHLLL